MKSIFNTSFTEFLQIAKAEGARFSLEALHIIYREEMSEQLFVYDEELKAGEAIEPLASNEIPEILKAWSCETLEDVADYIDILGGKADLSKRLDFTTEAGRRKALKVISEHLNAFCVYDTITVDLQANYLIVYKPVC